MKKEDLPKKIAIFPLSNFIIFPRTTVPLNIFEPRYIDMVNDCMKSGKLIGMIQPKNKQNENNNYLKYYFKNWRMFIAQSRRDYVSKIEINPDNIHKLSLYIKNIKLE